MFIDIWHELAIPATDDERAIKRAYAKRLKAVRPDDDPEGFQRLRAAYEYALDYAQRHADDVVVALADEHDSAEVEEPLPTIEIASRAAPAMREAARSADVLLEEPPRPPPHSKNDALDDASAPLPVDESSEESTPDAEAAPSRTRRNETPRPPREPRAHRRADTARAHFDAQREADELIAELYRRTAAPPYVHSEVVINELLDDMQRSSLALREAFERQLLRTLSDRPLPDPDFLLGVAAALGWSGNEEHLERVEPQAATRVLAWVRGARQYDDLRERQFTERTFRMLLGDFNPKHYRLLSLNRAGRKHILDTLAELQVTMPELMRYFVDQRIVEWWEREGTKAAPSVLSSLLWLLLAWIAVRTATVDEAMPWNLRGATSPTFTLDFSQTVFVSFGLGMACIALHRWSTLRWRQRWADAWPPAWLSLGWSLAVPLLVSISAFDRISTMPMRMLMAPLIAATMIWMICAMRVVLDVRGLLAYAIGAGVCGLWLALTKVITDSTLAAMVGAAVCMLILAGRHFTRDWVHEHRSRALRFALLYGWRIALAALFPFALIEDLAQFAKSPVWLVAMSLCCLWAMSTTYLHFDKRGTFVFYAFAAGCAFSSLAVDFPLGPPHVINLALAETIIATMLVNRFWKDAA